MARKTLKVTIEHEGRDKGKVFEITEMSAFDAEAWATRALLALSRGGANIPDDLLNRGFVGLLVAGIQMLGSIDYKEAKPLFDEMMLCVRMEPSPGVFLDWKTVETTAQVEEVRTLFTLREAVLTLHVGFSIAAEFKKSKSAASGILSNLSLTQTSPKPSGS